MANYFDATQNFGHRRHFKGEIVTILRRCHRQQKEVLNDIG
jgi:hypothetical protein